MKKILLLMVLFLTACSSEAMKGYLTVKCVKEDEFNDTKNTNTITIKHKDNNITNIEISYKYETTNKYTLDSYKQSLISESRKYKNVEIEKNENKSSFELIYKIDYSNTTNEIKQEFNLEELESNQVKNLEKKGYSCK